jgi:L-ascorbate metabolism protein UlaG (beta-lactamase superfamily)
MELTKHNHACVTLDKEGSRLLLDPGTFNTNAAELVASAGTILLTHEHFDHVDEEAIAAALAARPELRVYGPAAVVDRSRPSPKASVSRSTVSTSPSSAACTPPSTRTSRRSLTSVT